MKVSRAQLGAAVLAACTSLSFNVHAIEAGTYQISAKHSGKCLDVSGISPSNGAKVHQWACHGDGNQQWRVKSVNGAYQLQAVHSGKCLDVEGVSYARGAMMQQWSCGYGANQHFYIDRQSDGYYRVKAKHSEMTVEIGASSNDNGANVKQWSWWAGDSQRFAFKRVGDTGGGNEPARPAAVWSESFESQNIGSRWFGKQHLEVRGGCGTNSSRCVRATYYPTSQGSQRIVFRHRLPTAREYTLNYDVMFENGFDFVHGGKLPGLGPLYETAGCAPRTDRGWSARVMWRDHGAPVIYSYDQNRANRCGEDYYSSIQFQTGQYHAVSLHVKVNEPAWLANGLIELYVDGRRVATQANVQLRSVGGRDSEINQLLFDTFFGWQQLILVATQSRPFPFR